MKYCITFNQLCNLEETSKEVYDCLSRSFQSKEKTEPEDVNIETMFVFIDASVGDWKIYKRDGKYNIFINDKGVISTYFGLCDALYQTCLLIIKKEINEKKQT